MKAALILPLFLLPVVSEKKPHIVVVIVDDLGENSTFDNIDKLSEMEVALWCFKWMGGIRLHGIYEWVPRGGVRYRLRALYHRSASI